MKKKVNEGLEMDMTTYKKVKGTIDPKANIKITGDKPSSTDTSMTSVTEDGRPEASIKPQATIKYLSNVKDDNGKVSKPFTIGGKNYQMVRGESLSKEIVMGVYCHDNINENGENIIHPIDYFEKNIANPAKVQTSQEIPMVNKSETVATIPKTEEHKTDNSLKLSEFKHFVIDSKTGKVRKFKRAEELAKANMTETEKYMNLQQFKKHVDETLFGTKQRKSDVSEANPLPEKPDVKLAIEQMMLKVSPYMNKINEPIEKIQLLVKLTQMLKLDSSKYPMLMAELKKASSATFDSSPEESNQSTQMSQSTEVNENKVITKNDLINSVSVPKVIRTIKVKDIK